MELRYYTIPIVRVINSGCVYVLCLEIKRRVVISWISVVERFICIRIWGGALIRVGCTVNPVGVV